MQTLDAAKFKLKGSAKARDQPDVGVSQSRSCVPPGVPKVPSWTGAPVTSGSRQTSIGIHSKHLPPLRRLQCKRSLHTSRKHGCQSTLCRSKPRRLPPCARVIQAEHLTTSTETIPIEPDAVGRCHGDKEASGSFPRLVSLPASTRKAISAISRSAPKWPRQKRADTVCFLTVSLASSQARSWLAARSTTM